MEPKKYKRSISKKVIFIVIASVFFTCIVSIAICLVFYMRNVKHSCEDFANVISKQAAGYIDGDKVSTFLKEGDKNSDYKKTEKNLNVLYKNGEQIEYLFVYAIREDGVHVVFDIDTPSLKGDESGTVLEPEQGVSSEYEKYLHGEKIPIQYSNGKYGNILTVYSQIYDSKGNVVAYAGVDIDMSTYYHQVILFAIQVITLIFFIAIAIFSLILRYIQRNISTPIQTIVKQAEQLEDISPDQWIESDIWKQHVAIHTEDELEQLYDTVRQVEEKASLSMKRLMETEQELLQSKELERVNQELEATAQKAEDANRAKTDFLARMSHDMRTPLNGILNFSKFIESVDSIDDAKKYGRKIFTSGQYLETLINDTLGMSRIESGKIVLKPEPYAYDMFEASIKNVLEEKARNKGVELHFQHDDNMSNVLFLDQLRIQQVCINILNNAIKFTPKGGQVTLKTERVASDGKEETLRISISDTGIGMSQKFMKEQLFKPFAQEKLGKDNEETGTGLGLSIAKQLVEIMNGTLTCESTEGEGTTFVITLKAAIVEDNELSYEKQKIDMSKLQGLQVLLCEDHALNREIAIKLLKQVGCIVDIAEDGLQGVQMFEHNYAKYHLILMDVRMPVLDGIQATKKIRNLEIIKAKTIPIIAMTANAYEDDIKDCLAAGMNAHIAKPIQPKNMYQIIIDNL